ncbi:hypothetical protein [Alicyclobacillus sp. SO9]|uniref:hypothetical protein n=1 Tax=Alicyclobacillus sp. SO9 TaxID=2665646 RepID=UPI0018E8F6D5|nr:hypothetical protein [Alicyclobacillus sp. SO9]QQE77760.1 hypothetical protein GI364_17760 [Alicyclobacillus sp. SO9]
MQNKFPWGIRTAEKDYFEDSKKKAIEKYNAIVAHINDLNDFDPKWMLEQVKYLYDKQITRGQTIEGKVTRMFGVLSISFTLLTFLFIQIPFHMIAGHKFACELDILQIVLALLFFYSMFSTLYFLFKTMTMYTYSKPNEEFLTLGRESTVELIKDFTYGWLYNETVDNFKGALVEHTIRSFSWTIIWFIACAITEFLLRGVK